MRKLAIGILLLLIPLNLSAIVIDSIELIGLKRTKEKAILPVIPVQIGQEYTVDTKRDVTQSLRKLGLFSEVEVEFVLLEPEKGRLNIQLKEKWSTIPIPFFSYSEDEITAGFFLLESNLFGLRKTLVTGGVYNPDNTTAILIYTDPYETGKSWGQAISAIYAEEEGITNSTFSYGISPPWGGELLRPTLSIRNRFQKRDKWYTYPGSRLSLELDMTKLGTYFYRGLKGEGQATLFYDLDQEDYYPETQLRLEGNITWKEKNNLVPSLISQWDSSPLYLRSSIRNVAGSLSVPEETYFPVWSHRGALTYNRAIGESESIFYSLNGFAEAGILKMEKDVLNYWGAGGGFQILLKKMVVPALGIYGAYNFVLEDWVYNFTVGMSM